MGEVTKGLENGLWRSRSERRVGEWAVAYVKWRKGWRMGRAHSPNFPSLHLRHSSFSNPSVASPTSQPILQPFRRFTYVTAHSPTLPSLYLPHSSFSNPSVALPTSQLILQPFRHFTYVTAHSPTLLSLLICHRLFTWRAANDLVLLLSLWCSIHSKKIIKLQQWIWKFQDSGKLRPSVP